MNLFQKTIEHFKPYKGQIALTFLCAIVAGAVATLPPILTGKLVDEILPMHLSTALYGLIVAVLGSFILKVMFESLQEYIQVRIGLDVISDMQMRAFRKLHRAPMSMFATTPRGDILYRLTHDVEAIQQLNSTVIPRFLQQLLGAIAAFAAVITLYWPVAVLMVGVFVIYLYPSFKLGKKVRGLSATQRDMLAALYSHAQESIESIKLVRTFQLEDREYAHQNDGLEAWKRFAIRAALISKVNWRLGNALQVMAPGFVMLLGGYAVWRGEITVGTLVACIGFIPAMFMPIRSLAENALTIQQAIPALHRLYEYFDLPEEQPEGLPKFATVQGKIEMEDLWFRYPGTEEPILRGISLAIEPGQHIGLVGASGGGKSTLIQLLLGLYTPEQGRVAVDGCDLNEYDRNSLRLQVGVVSQETFLLNETLRKNLLYSKPDATQAELDRAVVAAGLTEMIESLPDGYETVVGERGLKLSGGQKQRVAMARAILRHPQVLIFDEATSSLDGETEERVQAALEELIPGRTTITIAHRLVTVRHADRIFVLVGGQIAESGTHDELLAMQGQYHQLYMAQYSELEKEEEAV
ncbi:ABC transporter ATP-binding protein [Tumebacillus permanentifrigoris]|uniref:ATP-binding cassette subfamily B protein n=1 Tax=Tumebacillus permanentifrigoris TaxID=378543 RepID=A0A316D8G9_9BACL|nr:ABC transporter ATP-binding protein [Tumebacillus permanentifrigoris]PWK13143.1 ATP-binding cassette subfamily B protein [Tumebacillus permanentifrigoris]